MTDSALIPYHLTVSTPALVPNPVPRLPGLSLPAELRVGDTLSFEIQTQIQPPAGWFLFYVLNAVLNNVPTRILLGSIGPGAYTVGLDASGIAAFSIAGSVTSTWTPGRYEWVAFSVDPQGNRRELVQGKVTLLADVAGANPVDDRSYNQKCLDSIKVVISGALLDDTMIYKIGTRELTKISRMDLLKLEQIFEGRVNRERRARGEILPRRGLAVNFGGR